MDPEVPMKVPDIISIEDHAAVIRHGITLIEYYVTWCSPCRAQAAIIEGVADDVKGKVQVARVNLDQHHRTARALGIRSVPTLVVFVNGHESRRFIGLQSRETITGALSCVLQDRRDTVREKPMAKGRVAPRSMDS
jgi:thioredoxin 1